MINKQVMNHKTVNENILLIQINLFTETNTTIAKRRGPNPFESYLKGDD